MRAGSLGLVTVSSEVVSRFAIPPSLAAMAPAHLVMNRDVPGDVVGCLAYASTLQIYMPVGDRQWRHPQVWCAGDTCQSTAILSRTDECVTNSRTVIVPGEHVLPPRESLLPTLKPDTSHRPL